MKKFILLTFVVSFFFFCNLLICLGQQSQKQNGNDSSQTVAKSSEENLRITDEIKSKLIKSILKQNPEIKSRDLPEWALENLTVNISEKNIVNISLPKFPKINFILLTEQYIKNYEGKSLDYREFEYFKPEKYKITVYFSVVSAGKGFFPSKYKTTYECRNENEKWICRGVASSISN